MKRDHVTPVVLCGGSGTRLWPLSRASKPKPFLPLIGQLTLFEATLERCEGSSFGDPLVVTGSALQKHVETQFGLRRTPTIIVEPSAQNTAAAIALAAFRLPADAVMLVCPSDHHIADVVTFQAAAEKAATLARDGWLVSFGIEATSPETGFGYLERGESIGDLGFQTARFVEKPNLEKAKEFVASGKFAWNGGIFAFQVETFLSELRAHRPEIYETTQKAVALGVVDGRRFHPDAEAFAQTRSESVDYAVMENTSKAAMVPVNMGWSDIGSWDSLHAARDKDRLGNSVKGLAELVDCSNVLVESDGPRVSVIGLENVVVVVDGNEVLVTTHDGAQKVGKLIGASQQ